jgi:hypothetical protein
MVVVAIMVLFVVVFGNVASVQPVDAQIPPHLQAICVEHPVRDNCASVQGLIDLGNRDRCNCLLVNEKDRELRYDTLNQNRR